jgi:hypothetical protein
MGIFDRAKDDAATGTSHHAVAPTERLASRADEPTERSEEHRRPEPAAPVEPDDDSAPDR